MSETANGLPMQIVRLIEAIGNRYEPLAYSEPLVAACHERYRDLKRNGRDAHGYAFDFMTCSQMAKAEAVAALIARGTGLIEPPPDDAALGAGQAEERWMAELTTSERRQLFWLASNPGSWGGHADRGDPLDDREMQRWLRLGFIELLEHVETRGKYKTKFGYFLTAAGRAALSCCVGERT